MIIYNVLLFYTIIIMTMNLVTTNQNVLRNHKYSNHVVPGGVGGGIVHFWQ